jgi:WD40 repeat protein
VAFSPDGKTLAAAEAKDVGLWDLATGKKIGTLTGHDDSVTALAFSPDGKMLASSSGDIVFGKNAKLKFWDVESKQDKGTIETTRLLTRLSFTPDGKAVCSDGNNFDDGGWCWDVATRKKEPPLFGLRRFGLDSVSYNRYAYSAGGECVGASAHRLGEFSATVLEIPSRKQLVDIPNLGGELAGISCVAKTILCKEDKTEKLSLWDFSGKKRLDLEGKLLPVPGGVAFSHDGKYLAASMENKQFIGVLQVWDVATGKPLVTLNGESEFQSVAFSKDGELLAAGAERGQVKLWRVNAVMK